MKMLAHGAIGVELPEARGLRSCGAQGIQHLRPSKFNRCAGGRCRTEGRRRTGRVEVTIVTWVDGFSDAQRGLITDDHGGEKPAPERCSRSATARAADMMGAPA